MSLRDVSIKDAYTGYTCVRNAYLAKIAYIKDLMKKILI